MRNLVISPAGNRSLHQRWIGTPGGRSYDVWLNCYEANAVARFAGDPAQVFDARGTMKWQMISRLVAERHDEILSYDAVWFPDDDVSIDAAGVEQLFEMVHGLGLWLAQPALGDGSFYSHAITLENRSFIARFTNFVEIMAPAFSRGALERCASSFGESVSGWGLDRVWPRILGEPRDRIAIVDAVRMIHTQPVGGAGWYSKLKLPASDEEAHVAARHGVVPPFGIAQYGGIPREGPRRREAVIPAGAGFLRRIICGAPRSERWNGRFWRRHWRSILAGR